MFSCRRCGYSTSIKCAYKTHLQRKKKCLPLLEDIAYEVLLSELSSKTTNISCDLCGKQFTLKNNMSRHKKTCKERSINTDLVAEIATLKARIKVLEKDGGTHITNNIVINNFNGSVENTKYIEHEVLKDCIKELNITHLMEQIYFHPFHPENHNVRVKNIHRKTLEYYEEGRWMIDDTTYILTQCVQFLTHMLNKYYVENRAELEDDIDFENERYIARRLSEKIGKWFEKIRDDDVKLLKKLCQDIFLCIIKNKNIAKT